MKTWIAILGACALASACSKSSGDQAPSPATAPSGADVKPATPAGETTGTAAAAAAPAPSEPSKPALKTELCIKAKNLDPYKPDGDIFDSGPKDRGDVVTFRRGDEKTLDVATLPGDVKVTATQTCKPKHCDLRLASSSAATATLPSAPDGERGGVWGPKVMLADANGDGKRELWVKYDLVTKDKDGERRDAHLALFTVPDLKLMLHEVVMYDRIYGMDHAGSCGGVVFPVDANCDGAQDLAIARYCEFEDRSVIDKENFVEQVVHLWDAARGAYHKVDAVPK